MRRRAPLVAALLVGLIVSCNDTTNKNPTPVNEAFERLDEIGGMGYGEPQEPAITTNCWAHVFRRDSLVVYALELKYPDKDRHTACLLMLRFPVNCRDVKGVTSDGRWDYPANEKGPKNGFEFNALLKYPKDRQFRFHYKVRIKPFHEELTTSEQNVVLEKGRVLLVDLTQTLPKTNQRDVAIPDMLVGAEPHRGVTEDGFKQMLTKLVSTDNEVKQFVSSASAK